MCRLLGSSVAVLARRDLFNRSQAASSLRGWADVGKSPVTSRALIYRKWLFFAYEVHLQASTRQDQWIVVVRCHIGIYEVNKEIVLIL